MRGAVPAIATKSDGLLFLERDWHVPFVLEPSHLNIGLYECAGRLRAAFSGLLEAREKRPRESLL